MKSKITYNSTSRPEGAKSLAQGNALCSKTPHLQQAPKGRNQRDVALTGLYKYGVNLKHRALPYANDSKAFSLTNVELQMATSISTVRNFRTIRLNSNLSEFPTGSTRNTKSKIKIQNSKI